MVEKNGVRIAAVSYDSQDVLKGFAEKHGIGGQVFTYLQQRS